MSGGPDFDRHSILEQWKNFFIQDMKTFLPLIRSSILTGIFVVIPIFLSLWAAWAVYSWLTEWAVWCMDELMPSMPEWLSPFWMGQFLRVLSLIVVAFFLFLIGLLTKIAVGRRLIRAAENLLLKLPIIRFIYTTCKQIGDALWSSKGGNMFHQVVLFEYPRKGCWAIGFLTNENKGQFEITEKIGRQMVSIFMPTTPNPTSGFLILIPRDECIFLDMSVADAMRLIVSCGAVLPNTLPPEEENAPHGK